MDGQTDGRCDFNMPPEVPSGHKKKNRMPASPKVPTFNRKYIPYKYFLFIHKLQLKTEEPASNLISCLIKENAQLSCSSNILNNSALYKLNKNRLKLLTCS